MALVKNSSLHQRGRRQAPQRRRALKPQDIHVKDIPLFSSLDSDEALRLQEGLEFRSYRRGERIFSSGAVADRLYIVCEGMMKIFKYLPDGRELLLYLYSEGDFVGGFNLLRADEYRYNAEALEPSVICTLSKESFDRIVLNNPKILLKIVEKGFERVRWAEELVDRLNSPSADHKLAALLLDLMRDFSHSEACGLVLQLRITQEDMGNYTGLTRETVSRKLGEFRDKGLIQLEGNRRIILKDIEALRAIAEREL